MNSGYLTKNSDIYSVITQISSEIASAKLSSNNQVILNNLDFNLINRIMIQTLLYGNCYVIPINQGLDGFKLIDNSSVEIEIDNKNNITYKFNDNDSNEVTTYDSSEVLHFRINPSDSYGLDGTSPLESLKATLDIQQSANNILKKFYSQGVHGSLVLKLNSVLDKDKKDKLRNKFVDSINDNLGAIVTDQSMDISTLSNAIDSDILKIAQNTDYLSEQVAKAFSVPNFVLGVEDNHSNQEQVQNTYNNALMNIYQPIIESELNAKLSGSYSFSNVKYLSINDLISLKENEILTNEDIKKSLKI
ncbi:phage portal protein [Apilactobacillus micheneri]|uniref:phage portal protein n=1 Tax=Apilactobacillus micheneri TaxID=1899430 RepID=UPI0021F06961|nr:phage portal protein [Apilactobacillus micheneri]